MLDYRVDHVHLKSQDIDATAQWYCDVLGGKTTGSAKFKGSDVRFVDLNGFTIIIYGRMDGEEEPIPASLKGRYGVDHFGIAVDDIEQFIEYLKSKGVRILEGPMSPRPGVRVAFFEGPDHVRIELTERK